MKLEIEAVPSIIVPSKDFLVGAICGINVMRRPPESNPPAEVPADTPESKISAPLMGHWLEVTCEKCKRFYGFENANDIPFKTLICDTQGCGNHIIVYGVVDPKAWKLGPLVFVK